jgi:hypothetical protein
VRGGPPTGAAIEIGEFAMQWMRGLGWLTGLLMVCTAPAAVIYVDDDAPHDPGPGDPLISDPLEDGSAGHPFDEIQEALDAAADGDEVVLADGVYPGRNGAHLDMRNKHIYLHSASGDPATCVIDGQGYQCGLRADASWDEPVRIEGLTIRDTRSSSYGGGLWISDGVTVANCVIADCVADESGGGVVIDMGRCVLRDCQITGNQAMRYGGGVFTVGWMGSVQIIGCTVTDNHLPPQLSTAGGAGIACDGAMNLTIEDSLIAGNESAGRYGGGILAEDTDYLSVNRCVISTNRAATGGGISLQYTTNVRLRHCAIGGNVATAGTAGVSCELGGGIRFEHCSIVTNSSAGGKGGVTVSGTGGVEFDSCVIRGNRSEEVWGTLENVTMDYCNIEGGWSGAGVGNIDIDALFVEEPGDGGDGWYDNPHTPDVDESANNTPGDLRLLAGSPCIDAGDPNVVPPAGLDLDGHARLWDGDGDGVAIVDMGAFEFAAPPVCAGDSDCDGDIDFDDITYFVTAIGDDGTAWASLFASAPTCAFVNNDMNGDDAVDFDDIEPFVNAIGSTCP